MWVGAVPFQEEESRVGKLTALKHTNVQCPSILHCSCRKTRGSNLLINCKKHLSHYEKSFLTPGAAEMLGKAQRMNGTQIHTLKRKR